MTIRARTLLAGLGILLGVGAALWLVLRAEKGLTIIAIALFLALALNPAVEFFQRHGLRRGFAVATVYVLAVMIFALLALVFIPPLVTQMTHFVSAVPGLVDELTRGRGPLGFLERKYHVVEEVQKAASKQGASGVTGAAAPVLGIAKGVATTISGMLIIAFLTLFMLFEGPEWRRRITGLIPEPHRARSERIGAGVYKSVSGFVTGNLLASFLAGVVATVILLIVGVPYALALGLFTAIIEFIPYVGPVVVTVLLGLVALTVGPVSALVVFVLMVVYHLVEGHTLRPLIYGHALKLSPLAVLIAIILGAEVAGILGVLVAIPIAGSVQVIVSEVLDRRNRGRSSGPDAKSGTAPVTS
ncbi:AI-2E family transporter [Kribbella qitaiheensis]|uniref:AI-2E family transporter n=1 Tax=Kribbella qitaiheensis TaxID=1544730 RepID=UPI001624045F|nr:AI-2E family transporter [Kribbella qitaiheensis]